MAGEPSARLNGRPAALQSNDQGWIALWQKWNDGDELVVNLPMRLSVHALLPKQQYPTAVTFGPVVLAVSAPNRSFVHKLDLADLDRSLERVREGPLTWRLSAEPDVLFRPFFAFREAEPRYLYLAPAAGPRRMHGFLVYDSAWIDAGQFHFSNAVGVMVACEFEGSGIRWLDRRFYDAGRAEVFIDNTAAGVVDQYGLGRNLSFLVARRPQAGETLNSAANRRGEEPELKGSARQLRRLRGHRGQGVNGGANN